MLYFELYEGLGSYQDPGAQSRARHEPSKGLNHMKMLAFAIAVALGATMLTGAAHAAGIKSYKTEAGAQKRGKARSYAGAKPRLAAGMPLLTGNK